MKYTDYFSFYLKNYGVPDLSAEQWQRLLNIVFMESLIVSSSETQQISKNHNKTYRQTKSLNSLTGRKEPILLMKEMLKLSKKVK
ncbi:hypothetical protein [Cochleicola gelatinilyticus]|uniref:Uncharacterized protein n=1 Tax=Cochleicola gelatinilyticus TaxID=1763537 RepID=A0A167IKT2_9FLAO|nr:hypothetical protein [Cochleicola gelatinilyticus]OAB79757.1 hypothetical protein ULVI_03150 [Cochleicola gelatinilyticus]